MAHRRTAVGWTALWAVAILAMALAPVPALASSSPPALDPQLTAAFARLATDIKALLPGEREEEGNAEALLAMASAAGGHAARGQLCQAVVALDHLQEQVSPRKGERDDSKHDLTEAAATTIVNDILAIDSIL